MSAPKLANEWITFYNSAFHRDAHQLLAWGYEDARSTIRSDHLEEPITGFIVKAIKKRLDDPITPRRFARYFVDEEEYVRETDKTGRSRQRIDIVIECSWKLPRPEFMFEAKLLRKGGFPIGRYTGDDGMQCYIRGEYAADYPAGAMVAYVQSDTFDYWYAQLEHTLNADKKGDLFVITSLHPSAVVTGLPDEWASRHKRVNNSDIDIFHIFLDCSSLPNT